MEDTLMDMSKRGKVAREAASAKIILEAEGMTLEEAAKWVDKNCTDETVSRLRSRAAAKALFDEVRRQEELIHDLAGVLWRLEEYSYIGREIDDEERGQCDGYTEDGHVPTSDALAAALRAAADMLDAGKRPSVELRGRPQADGPA